MDGDSRDLGDYLRPGELGQSHYTPEGTGYGEWLDCDCSPEAAAMLAYIDRWSDGQEPGLPPELLDGSLLAQVAQKLALRLLMVKGKLGSERHWPKHNAAVRLTLGRRAAATEHAPEVKAAALALFDLMVAEGRPKKSAYKAVQQQHGVSERTLRNWKKTP